MNTVHVKITVSNNGTRRMNVDRETSFGQFQQQVKELFGLQNELDWVYIDEEDDVVTFSTEQEWHDNLQSWQSEKVLKINATARPIQQQIEHSEERQIGRCPFVRRGNQQGRCCASFYVRFLLPLAIFYAIFTHPFLTLIGFGSLLFITYKHHPATLEKIRVHAKAHWRKVAFVFALRLMLSCSTCTLFFLIPIGFVAYRKFKRCHGGNYCGSNSCCFVKARDSIRNFMASHRIINCEDACKFACAVLQGKKCPAQAARNVSTEPQSVVSQPQVQPTEFIVPQKQPSAPSISEIYPQVSEEPILPQRSEPVEPYANMLEALQLMGFNNQKLNEHLLRNFNGNLDRVITSLLQLSAMQGTNPK
jgi:hypothetical protein